MFAASDDNDGRDSFEVFLETKKGKKEALPVASSKEQEPPTHTLPSVQPHERLEMGNVPSSVRAGNGAVSQKPLPVSLRHTGGNVALRHTAPSAPQKPQAIVPSFSLRKTTRDVVPSRDGTALGAAPSGPAGQVLLGMQEAATYERGCKLSDDQIRYGVGGDGALIFGGSGSDIAFEMTRLLDHYGGLVTLISSAPKPEGLPDRVKWLNLGTSMAFPKEMQTLVAGIPDVKETKIVLFVMDGDADPGDAPRAIMSSCAARRVIVDGLLARGLPVDARIFLMSFCGVATPKVDLTAFVPSGGGGAWKVVGNLKQHQHSVAGNDALVLGYRNRHPQMRIWGLHPGLIATDLRHSGLRSILGGLVNLHALSPSQASFAWSAKGDPLEISEFLSVPGNVDRVWALIDDMIRLEQ